MSKDNIININVKEFDINNFSNKSLNKTHKENFNNNHEQEISKSIRNYNHNIGNENFLNKEFDNLNINKNIISNDNGSDNNKEIKDFIYYKNEVYLISIIKSN